MNAENRHHKEKQTQKKYFEPPDKRLKVHQKTKSKNTVTEITEMETNSPV
jgi:hypothetical protein